MRVLDAPSRLLLGVDIMRDFEHRINFSTSVTQSSRPKQDAHLQSMETGHWAIDLYGATSVIEAAQDEVELAAVSNVGVKEGAYFQQPFLLILQSWIAQVPILLHNHECVCFECDTHSPGVSRRLELLVPVTLTCGITVMASTAARSCAAEIRQLSGDCCGNLCI